MIRDIVRERTVINPERIHDTKTQRANTKNSSSNEK